MLKHVPFYSSLLDKKLNGKKPKHSHVLVYGAIEAHSMGPKGCIASNTTIAKEVGLASDTVSNLIGELAKGGWVHVYLKENGKRDSIMPLGSVVMPLDSGVMPLDSGALYIENTEDYSEGVTVLKQPSKKGTDLTHDSKDINSLIIYFHQKLCPAVAPVFSPYNRKAIDAMLSTVSPYGVKEVRDTIDKAEKLLSLPFAPAKLKVTKIGEFAFQFKAIREYQITSKGTTQETRNF